MSGLQIISFNTASPPTDGQLFAWDAATGTVVPIDGATVFSSVAQTAHGLAVGDAVRFNGSGYVQAQADSAANAEAVGIVSIVADVDHFTLVTNGKIDTLSGLTPGDVYFVDPSTAGALTNVAPSATGQVSKPLLIADSATSGFVVNMRGEIVGSDGGSSLLLDLGLFDLTTLNDGPKLVYQPTAGNLVVLRHSLDGYVAHDMDAGSGEVGMGVQADLFPADTEFYILIGAGEPGTSALVEKNSVLGARAGPLPFATADPLVAMATGGNDSYPIDRPVGTWQSVHAYAEGDLIFGGDGQWYRAMSDGTSGSVEPVWPGATHTVTDNDFDWLGVGIPATVGAIHLYAIVVTARSV